MRYSQLSTHKGLYALAASGVSAGVPLLPQPDTSLPGGSWAIAIPATGNYLFPLGGERYGSVVETIHHSISLLFNASLAGTFTIEATNCAKSTSGDDMGGPDISDYDTTSGAWSLIDITQAGLLYAIATGTGNSMSAKLTATIGGTHAGTAFYNLPDIGAMRLRGNLNVTTVGKVRVSGHSKLGS